MTRDKIPFCVSLAYLAGDVVVAEVELLQRGEAGELPRDPAAERVLRQAEHAEAPQAAQRGGDRAPQPRVGPEHDLLEGRRGRAREQRRRQLDAGAGAAGGEAAEQGERLEVRQAAQRGGVETGPGLQGGVATSGPKWRRVARSTRASSGAASHWSPGHGVSVQGRGWSCGHAGSPRRSAITRNTAASSALGSCGAASPAAGCAVAAWSWSRSKMARESAKESEGAIGACGGVYLLAILGGV